MKRGLSASFIRDILTHRHKISDGSNEWLFPGCCDSHHAWTVVRTLSRSSKMDVIIYFLWTRLVSSVIWPVCFISTTKRQPSWFIWLAASLLEPWIAFLQSAAFVGYSSDTYWNLIWRECRGEKEEIPFNQFRIRCLKCLACIICMGCHTSVLLNTKLGKSKGDECRRSWWKSFAAVDWGRDAQMNARCRSWQESFVTQKSVLKKKGWHMRHWGCWRERRIHIYLELGCFLTRTLFPESLHYRGRKAVQSFLAQPLWRAPSGPWPPAVPGWRLDSVQGSGAGGAEKT